MTEAVEPGPFDPQHFGPTLRRIFSAGLCFVGAALSAYAIGESSSELQPAATRALFILLLAASLWVSELVPAYAVGLLVIALQIALLGRPDGVFATSQNDWEAFVGVLGHPLVWLFFGGFVLAAGMQRCGLDRMIARRLLGRFGSSPSGVLLGVMSVTFVLSMFISNTATTAMMLAILAPLVRPHKSGTGGHDDRFATGLLIGCAVAANLGGMGSLIGTPPNAIAVGALAEQGKSISFLQWMWLGMPPAVGSLIVAWRLVLWLYPSSEPRLDAAVELAATDHLDLPGAAWRRAIVSATLGATLVMWLTSGWHGIPTAAVALLPIVVFTTTSVLSAEDIRGLSYDVLFLLAGGLALGQMLAETGLSSWLVGLLPFASMDPIAVVVVLAAATVLLSNVMSNTAAANVLVPIGVSAAAGFETSAALAIAFGASSAMCLPVATPPNAMVYSTGQCRSSDFLRVGIPMGVLAPALGILWIRLLGPSADLALL